MNKILVGLIVGAICGAVDGATAWFEPAVRPDILMIIFLSTIKGVIAGIAAGWFARKVQSVPKGIAFGFIVGLILAFLVAMNPDPKTGEHYWWQIMLPGSVLGGVIGWATQRYGRPARTALATLMLVAFAAFPAQAGDGVTAADAFQSLTKLAGKWSGPMLTPDGPIGECEYRVTGGGSVVMLTQFPGTPHEMITMFTVDGQELVATHYCAGGNQPTMKLNVTKSSPNDLVFDFVKVTGSHNHDHIHDARIQIKGDKLEESWNTAKDAKKFYLSRN